MKLFVYGSLKRDSDIHNTMLPNAQFIREAVAEGYNLYKISWYPGMVAGIGKVHGEVYDVSEHDVYWLDLYEGIGVHGGGQFVRRIIEIDNNETVEAYLYVGDYSEENLIESGQWQN